jgi:hypothetical protein
MLSYGRQSADVGAPKYKWYGDWLFMFAGPPSSTELVVEQIRLALTKKSRTDPFSRQNIQKTVREAFTERRAQWSAIRNLSMYGMNMQEFIRNGARFPKTVHSQLVRAIYNDAKANYSDEIMVVGWGKSALSVMLYVIDKGGDSSHFMEGHCAIGIGRDAAIRALLKLKHGLRSSLQDTIYSVAAAKFAAEGKWVGRKTEMWLLRKRTPQDDPNKPVAIDVPEEKIEALRTIWKQHRSSTEVADKARKCAASIVELTKDEATINRGSWEQFKTAIRRSAPRNLSKI